MQPENAVEATDTENPAAPARPQRNWARLGLIAAGAIVLALVAVVLVRVALSAPHPPLGETDAAALQAGSCVAESAVALERYTVVDCSDAHPQQVFGVVEMTADSAIYTQFSAMTSFVEQVCDRYLEYGLFVKKGVKSNTYEVVALSVPTEAEFTAGRTTATCAISARDGSDLVTDLYQRMP